MDGQQFDALTRRLVWIANRRSLLGAVATALVAKAALPESALACKKVGRKCDKNKDCCDHAKCKGDKKDKKGKCRCKNGFRECSNKCFDLDKDENHCGDCDTTCGASETCCSGECVNLQTSNNHCGSCNTTCPEGAGCIEGVCFDP